MSRQKNLKRNLLICLLAGSAVMYTLPLHAATSVVANNALPQNGQFFNGNEFIQGTANEKGNGFDFADIGSITKPNDLTMNVHQNEQNAVIKWDSFDVGGSATVNFTSDKSNFNTLNYVNSGAASQIYGTINGLGGNIYVVNTAGVQIGPSAQINVGSLYVSNNVLDDSVFNNFVANANNANFDLGGNPTTYTDAALMSLGNINANNVTFEGNGRIVIDSERIKTAAGDDKLGYQNINIKTANDNTGNVIIGYEAYDETNKSYAGANGNSEKDRIATINGNDYITKAAGYMWVEDVEQLQAIDTNLSGNYALRNSIDATATENWNDNNGFSSIGVDENGKTNGVGFTGNFDGIDYNIFGLTINRSDETNVGLFGAATNANINNVTLVGGKIIGGTDVGAIVGAAEMTNISNVTNSAKVEGNNSVGGIVGVADATTVENAINTGAVEAKGNDIGGLIGSMTDTNITDNKKSELIGNSYNLGDVSSEGHNVGGLVGHAVNSTIGDGTNLVYNRLDVGGAYNVGGIVGNMKGTTVQNAENSGNVMATGYDTENYIYNTANTDFDKTHGENNDGVGGVEVNVANVGGIAGNSSNSSTIENVTNTGNVNSNTDTYEHNHTYYTAGNVGGVVGRAENTNITNATNRENEVRGAHNVGGVAGYFSGIGTVDGGINDGGDIMATGARAAAGVNGNVVNEAGFAREQVRPGTVGDETFIIGNMGGVVGYMDGDNVYVTGSANRGTVHSEDITDPGNILYISQAANTGGIVGKINRNKITDGEGNILTNEAILAGIKEGSITAAVTDSYNTGDVTGYSGVGGVVGMMYNGEVADSYNLGSINTTRKPKGGDRTSVNMGGVVGDTTEGSGASAVIYNVYNKGQIGDDDYETYARHVGGIVGRLSGTVDKAYNTGNIYNGFSVVGGIAGWFYEGTISNAFNTGNITVYNNETNGAGSQVGGIAGGMAGYNTQSGVTNTISNAYNLGTLRSFTTNSGGSTNSIGGIVGKFVSGSTGNTNVVVENVYTTGNLYADDNNSGLGAIYGTATDLTTDRITIDNAYYITPENTRLFNNLSTNAENQGADVIAYANRDEEAYWTGFTFSSNGSTDGNVDDSGDWRIYDGTTPILNAFLPDSEKYFENGLKDNDGTFVGTIQYGTAYDPLLTIINTNRDLSFDFGSAKAGKLSITNAAGLVIYGGGLTLNDFTTSGGTGYFGGIIYSDGTLNIAGADGEDIGFGSGADIYGSSVNIDADGTITIYGDVTATGNTANGATKYENDTITVNDAGNITITSDEGDVNVYGTLTSAAINESTNIAGIAGSSIDNLNFGTVGDRFSEVTNMGERFAYTTGTSDVNGNITIKAGTWTDDDKDDIQDAGEVTGGNIGLYYGNKGEGITTTGGNLTITGTGDVYVDSDLEVGGNMTLTSTGKDGEVLLTLTNIGKVQANRFAEVVERALNGKDLKGDRDALIKAIVDDVKLAYPTLSFTNTDAGYIVDALNNYAGNENNKVQAFEKLNNEIAVEYMHDFMHSFNKDTQNQIDLNATSGNAKLTVDMWDYNNNKFDFKKYDTQFYGTQNKHLFVEELDNLAFYINNQTIDASKTVYVEVSTGEQLKGIQDYVNSGVENASDALKFNYALMGDINASDVTGYKAIGTNSANGFTGTFDGRGNRIIGLKVDNNNGDAGIFSTIGASGTVKNVNIYSGNFTGTTSAGAVAGVNNGRIENVTGFGNTVTSNGNAGGIVGENNGNKGNIITNEDGTITLEPAENEQFATGIIDVESIGSVIAKGDNAVAGGLVGTNEGALGNSYSDSAVTSTFVNNQAGLGGVVGVNTEKGNVQYVDSLGVTNGGTTGSSNVGGVIGINKGNMYSGYNESIVSGKDNVGGIIGDNNGSYDDTDTWTGGIVENVVNATGVTGTGDYVGGLVGTNIGIIENGRNNGTITGTNYVGGMVGSNADEHSVLANLTNDSAADISGENYVGGIAGTNSGTITAQNQSNLINRGSITGQNYVGGVAGENIGTIEYVKNDVNLYVKDDTKTAQYFGGVAGINGRVDDTLTTEDETATGTITSATNEGDVVAENAQYVGGIVGWNTVNGVLDGMGNSNTGRVEGATYVGGVAGKNDADITGTADNIITIENTGVVIAHNGGAGGIFGENTGDIQYAEMSNSGIVSGTNYSGIDDVTNGTGGIIGVNSGDITYSSITNTVDGQVTGINNVGGLIGYNTGTIIGGRNEAQETDEDGNVTAEEDSYYKYKVYNNGTITVTGSGSNIGGLIGNNAKETINGVEQTGSLTAGYNTGAINAGSSSNVGGIVGNNAGKVDQVFNTVMTPEGEGAITGGNNVGGLIGTNSGTLSNAYNTTEVKPTNSGVVGNAVGENSGTITNIYTTNTTGQLIGSGYDNGKVTKAYSFVANDTSVTEVISETADTDNDGITDRVDSDSYGGFDFSNDTWKNYDGSGNPLLKVFLTTVKVDTDDLPNLVYNTKDQDLNIDGLTGVNGAFSAADDFTAYENNNSLIQNTGFKHKNAGTYDNWLYSQQIASGSQDGTFNPNNLGYDIELTHDIDKAQITVDLNEVERTYGDTTILNNGNYNYSYDFANVTDETDLANLRNELNNKDVLSLGNVDKTKDDGGLVEDGTKTNNAGDYNWTGTVNIADGYQGNYEFVLTTEQSNDNQSSLGTNGTSITTIGDSIVNAKTITLGDFLATIVYGNQNNEFTYSGYEDWLEDQLVYGDHIGLSFSGATTGGAYETDKGNRDTADVGTYTDSITANVALTNNEKGNYVIESGSVTGDILVTPAQLDIVLGDVSHVYGSPNLNDYEANANGLVNGDNGSISVNVDSVTDGALSTDKQYTDDVGNYYWTVGNGGLNANDFDLGNYTINYVNQGDSEVIQANLTININDVNMTYGDLESWISGQYGYSASDIDGQKLVNGDSLADVIAYMTYNNTAYNSDETTKNVAEGNFALTSDGVTQGSKYGNYNITFNDGTVTMGKKQITIGANDEQIFVGETPNYSGTDINGVLVNGDSLNGNYHYGVADGTVESVTGTHNGAIGVWIGGSFYDLSNPDWSNLPGMSFFANYNVTFEPGTLTVSAYDIPEDWPHNRWDYLFNDAPFDRNRDFRERKAEVNFVDGGMEI